MDWPLYQFWGWLLQYLLCYWINKCFIPLLLLFRSQPQVHPKLSIAIHPFLTIQITWNFVDICFLYRSTSTPSLSVNGCVFNMLLHKQMFCAANTAITIFGQYSHSCILCRMQVCSGCVTYSEFWTHSHQSIHPHISTTNHPIDSKVGTVIDFIYIYLCIRFERCWFNITWVIA